MLNRPAVKGKKLQIIEIIPNRMSLKVYPITKKIIPARIRKSRHEPPLRKREKPDLLKFSDKLLISNLLINNNLKRKETIISVKE
ncbi:MAG: hypothetical protein A2X64_06885 [Ignavibacteria bacterium GWF2_33_9]|nr:MAG: hypothetical protein A2X64_06885 [Ignavibacteria bacterium GWF2_33_9]